MPVYKGRDPKAWRVVIWAKGRRYEAAFRGLKSEAEAFEARERIRLRAQSVVADRAPATFSTFLDEHYRPWAEAHLGASTWKSVRRYQCSTLEEHFGGIKLDAIASRDVDRYKAMRLETVKVVSVNNELRVLQAMLNWARDDRGFQVSDVKIGMLPTRGERRVRWWTAEEIARVYDAAREVEPQLLPLLVFLVNTGCRKGEALAAEWSWIDGGTLRIPITDEWQPKGKKPREVPLSDAARAALAGPRKHSRWVFPSSLGERFTRFPKEAFAHVMAAAKVEGTPHSTRHTFASHFLQAVPDLFLLSQLLGHSHTRTTELYSHLLPGHLSRARNAVNLGPAPKTVAATVAKRRK